MDTMNRPEIICICGSTRFADLHAIKRWEFERTGKAICLMINYLPAWYADKQGWNGHDHFGETANCKELLDELHLRKIDLADSVYVINPEGYIGNSTRREINYAILLGKPVEYMEDHYPSTGETARERITFCPQCGFDVDVDEDGCCVICGATATGEAVEILYRRYIMGDPEREASVQEERNKMKLSDILKLFYRHRDVADAIQDHAMKFVCDRCGRMEYPPYDIGDSCYDACGGRFRSA